MNWILLASVGLIIFFALIIFPLVVSRNAEKQDQDKSLWKKERKKLTNKKLKRNFKKEIPRAFSKYFNKNLVKIS